MIPPKTHPQWRALLTQPEPRRFEFLALKFLMSRLQLKLKVDASEAALHNCISELHAFAVRHEPQVSRDLQPLFQASSSLVEVG